MFGKIQIETRVRLIRLQLFLFVAFGKLCLGLGLGSELGPEIDDLSSPLGPMKRV